MERRPQNVFFGITPLLCLKHRSEIAHKQTLEGTSKEPRRNLEGTSKDPLAHHTLLPRGVVAQALFCRCAMSPHCWLRKGRAQRRKYFEKPSAYRRAPTAKLRRPTAAPPFFPAKGPAPPHRPHPCARALYLAAGKRAHGKNRPPTNRGHDRRAITSTPPRVLACAHLG